jgi:hypothetical protein
MGIQLGHLLSGAVATEVVFAWPGVGRLAVTSIFQRDYPVVDSVLSPVGEKPAVFAEARAVERGSRGLSPSGAGELNTAAAARGSQTARASR